MVARLTPGLATTSAPGLLTLDRAPVAGAPIALTLPSVGVANGVAELDAGALLPVARLPSIPDSALSVRVALLNVVNTFSVAQGIRAAPGATAAGLYVPWVTGDTLNTLQVGSGSTGNNQIAVAAYSDSQMALRGQSNSGVGLGGYTSTGSAISGVVADTGTNNAANALGLFHRSSAVPVAGFGTYITFNAHSAANTDRIQGRLNPIWTDPADGTYSAALTIQLASGGTVAERVRIGPTGSTAIRSTSTTSAAGLFVPWVSGDASGTVNIGSASSGNNQTALQAYSDTGIGLYGQSNTGTPLAVVRADAATNSAPLVIDLIHRTSATPTANFGLGIRFKSNSVTLADRTQAQILTQWTDAADATFSSQLSFWTTNQTVNAERMRLGPAGDLNIRAASQGTAAGLYVPWISGDTLATAQIGSATAGMNQTALIVATDTGNGALRIQTNGSRAATTIIASALTNTQVEDHIYFHRTSATPAAGFGHTIGFNANSTTVADRQQSTMQSFWTTATEGAQTGALRFALALAGSAPVEQFRINGSGAVGIRDPNTATAAGLYVPSLAGDTTPAAVIGSSVSPSTQPALKLIADGAFGALLINNVSGRAITAIQADATTSSLQDICASFHRSSATPAAGFGASFTFNANTSTTPDRNMASLQAFWTTATEGSQASAFRVLTVNAGSGLIEQFRVGPTGATGIRDPNTATAAGLYVPWVSGDTLATAQIGSVTSGNNQIAIAAYSDSNSAVRAQSTSSYPFKGLVVDTATATVVGALALLHRTSGTPVASFGVSVDFYANDSTTADVAQSSITSRWIDPAHATYSAALAFSTANQAVMAERMRLGPAGDLNIRVASQGTAAGLYVPWVSGDTLATAQIGSLTSGNNKSALNVYSDSGRALNIQTTSGRGLVITQADAQTATTPGTVMVTHQTSATPAAGFGVALNLCSTDTTTNEVLQAAIESSWVVATHAAQTARLRLMAYDTSAREGLRIEASGAAPMIGFLGAAAVVRQTLSVAASDAASTQTLANSLRTALINLGLAA